MHIRSNILAIGLCFAAVCSPIDARAECAEPTFEVPRRLTLRIAGEGLFGVTLPSGKTAYTRRGMFRISFQGLLIGRGGSVVLPGIVIPTEVCALEVSRDGVITVEQFANSQSAQVGQINAYRFKNARGLARGTLGQFRETELSGPPELGTFGRSGFGELR